MATDYIPQKDADFGPWLLNLATLATAAPATYGLTAPEAAAITAQEALWAPAYTLATDPGTRTPAAVANKDAVRAAAESTVRPLCVRVSLNPAVTAENKTALGVTVRKTVPTPVPAPLTRPGLALIAVTPGVQAIRYTDVDLPAGKSKPAGAIGLQLWAAIGTVPAVDPAQATFQSVLTKSPATLATAPGDRGKTITMFGRWVTRSGPGGQAQVGPWSDPLVSICM